MYIRNENIRQIVWIIYLVLLRNVRAKVRMFEYFITYDPRKRNKLTELRLGDALISGVSLNLLRGLFPGFET